MLSFVVTYFNEPSFLQWWYNAMLRLQATHEGKFCLVVVDDGSQKTPAYEFLSQQQDKSFLQLYVITEDIGFNNHGARNLGMRVAPSQWVYMSDIDRRYPDSTLGAMVDDVSNGTLSKGNHYKCSPLYKRHPISVNDYAVHKDDFWETGGYDEEFTNIHWGDRLLFRTLEKFCPLVIKENWKIKYTRMAREVAYTGVPITIYPDDKSLIHPDFWLDPKLRRSMIEYVATRNTHRTLRMRKPILQFPWERAI